jgi:hypothetical protein
MPKETKLMKQYAEWVTYQPAGADTSPDAFGRYLDAIAADESLDELLAEVAPQPVYQAQRPLNFKTYQPQGYAQ